MKNISKYVGMLLVVVAAFVLLFRAADDQDGSRNFIPADTTYAPVVVHTYRPKSTPFEKASKVAAKLPKGMNERNVARVIAIVRHLPADSVDKMRTDTTLIIESRTGDVLVPKPVRGSISVDITTYTPPVFYPGMFSSIGVSLAKRGDGLRLSPDASLALVEWYGVLHFPFFTADLDGVGTGFEYRLYDQIFIAPVVMWHYSDLSKEIKLQFNFVL